MTKSKAPVSRFPSWIAVVASLLSATFVHGQQGQLQTKPGGVCTDSLLDTCAPCLADKDYDDDDDDSSEQQGYDCSLPGLEHFVPGQYQGVSANYLSTVTDVSQPNFPLRAAEFQACTGGNIVFSQAANVWQDAVLDLGTKTSRGTELYDGYFTSYALFPEVSSLGLVEHLNERIRKDNDRLQWEDILPKVKAMGEYRKDKVTNIDFLLYDGDFFVPIVRLDLLERHNIPLPNTWDEVVAIAKRFNGTDLNDDGDPNDFGFCHFPRSGAGSWDQWWPESVYSTWASFEQTQGSQQGYLFDENTMEPRIGRGFGRAATVWKDLWNYGASDCGSPNFAAGRCAIGYAPPGCWKGVFLNGVSRRDANDTIIWQPTMKNGDYAEPYRFKPFGSLDVVNRTTGDFVTCTPELCPKAEVVPLRGHLSDTDRASVLPPSPYAGRLLNRAPLYWSGGLGNMIRASSPAEKKDLLWDFFVYTNSPDTSVKDVASYASWLDSWRYSQLSPGDNFLAAGWSQNAYEEHAAVMQWAFSSESNGAFNIRIPGITAYTRDVAGENLREYFDNQLSMDGLLREVSNGWSDVTAQRGKLDQLAIYRASLGIDGHSEVELCRLHRQLMDQRDPSICPQYDPVSRNDVLLYTTIPAAVVVILAGVLCYAAVTRKKADEVWKIKYKDLEIAQSPKILGQGTFGIVFLAEYRGTQVAVKCVVPRKSSSKGSIRVKSSSSDIESPSVEQVPSSAESMVLSTLKRGRMKSVSASYDYDKLKAEFLQEITSLARLRHPCITTIMGAVLEKNQEPLLVMEYMDHGSLRDLLQNETMVIDGEILLPILRDISQGVRFLHSSDPQIIHSDLKASNILVDNRYRAKVADFGLSQKRKIGAAGTPFWLAPEVLRRETGNTTQSDSYAFGIMLYEMYSRKEPYAGEDPTKVVEDVANVNVCKRPPVPPACPPKAAQLMEECLHSDPLKRPTFEELDLQLKRLDVPLMEPLGLKASENRSDALLEEVFPKHVAKALRAGRKVEPLQRDMVTVFFSDIENYTQISSSLTPMKVADLLRRLYTSLDNLTKQFGVKKIETIGDAYMATSNLTEDQDKDHVKRIAEFALAAIEAANGTLIDTDNPERGSLNLRCGFSSGPVVADVVGSLNPRWCLFGNVVNVANRMETASAPNCVLCDEHAAQLLTQQTSDLHVSQRGAMSIKGKGMMVTYWVTYNTTTQRGYTIRGDDSSQDLSGNDFASRVRQYTSQPAGISSWNYGTTSWGSFGMRSGSAPAVKSSHP